MPTVGPMIVTAHQPNYLPGRSLFAKLEAADAIVWLDEVQYTKGGWTNRNRLPGGAWLTVPVERSTDGESINRVRISASDAWRQKHVKSIEQAWGNNAVIEKVCEEIMRPYRLLVGLNVAVLHHLCEGTDCLWAFQSHLDGGHAVQAVSEERVELEPISVRLAMMVDELGGNVYLSGPSGRHYLDERPFDDLGIEVWYHQFQGTNDCVLSDYA